MPGVTKRIFDHEIRDIQDAWNKQLMTISSLLPCNYEEDDIIALLQKYYPHEWKSVEYKKQYYDTKDRYIEKFKGKARFNMKTPEQLLRCNQKYQFLLKEGTRKTYLGNYSEEKRRDEENDIWKKRESKIKRIDDKIARSISKTQTVTPDFLDAMIGLYERKNTTQMDRVYIIYELMKYYNPKVIRFFFKCNDTELNKQLREIAFKHLQSFDYMPRARRQKYMTVNTKNKKRREYLLKVYPNEKYEIKLNPNELEYRIILGKEQKMKTYKYFISHSSSDAATVQKLIDYENHRNILVFCDWINDSDYLKRQLLCEATLRVIEWRLRQAEEMIFVRSGKSLESVWCQYELNYFHSLGKNIYVIDQKNIDDGIFEFDMYEEKEYLNTRYKELVLINKQDNC